MSQTAEVLNVPEIERKIQSLIKFFRCYDSILSVNLVGFLTDNFWSLVPSPINSELLHLSTDALCTLPACSLLSSNTAQLANDGEDCCSGSASDLSALQEFIRNCNCHRLENLQVLTDLADLHVATLQNDQEQAIIRSSDTESEECAVRPKRNTFMAEKKSHEVETMAGVVAAIAKKANIHQVVDIGSGKGYLGQHLALQYSLDVLGIDSSHSNSHGAMVRGQKLRKQWPHKNKKSSKTLESAPNLDWRTGDAEKLDDGNATENNRTQRQLYVDDEIQANQTFPSEFQSKRVVIEEELRRDKKDGKGSLVSCAQCAKLSRTIKTESPNLKDTSKALITSQHCKCKQENEVVDNGQGPGACSLCCRIPQKDEEQEAERLTEPGTAQRTEEMASYQPVSAFVDTNTDIAVLINEGYSCSSKQKHVILCGLHTCGDLSSSMLRLFLANPSARILCNVPCCYHLLTEEFEHPSAMMQNSSSPMHYGFPMSTYLRSQKTKIGGVGRMVACMAAEKLAYEKKPPTDKLFFRAVLQVILKEHYTIPTREQRTGKLASKCSTFVEYTRRALKKMGYQEDKLSDMVIQQYYDMYKPVMKKLEAFNQLRAALAPSIGALILLDKLCFLKEQDSVQHAYLVRLFDPIKSPRCYGIIAVK